MQDEEISWRKEVEGGCGVVGFACSEKIAGRHVLASSVQMHNRGNGKGGGVLAVGLSSEQMGVSQEILENDYLLQIAFLEENSRKEVENEFIYPNFNVHNAYWVETIGDCRGIGLEAKPPLVCRYFVRVQKEKLKEFASKNGFTESERAAEDEFVYRNTFNLNKKFYASLGEKKAFVLSHGRNMFVFKIVGYAEQAIHFYKLEDIKANVWVAHQRYPTKGRVWHPAGAHPFIGLNEALVHNGDFANYHAVCEYLKQRGIQPLFLTDTEVSVLLFDLWDRVYKYPLEYTIEALAPTTERDFLMLPEEKKVVYKGIQATHMHGSPDGPWFFIIGRYKEGEAQLIGITDTSMLRPQVFALQEGEASIGLIASEKQAIDGTLRSLAEEDSRFCPIADEYWNARGGSHTDGGAFVFSVKDGRLECVNKFGKPVKTGNETRHAGEKAEAFSLEKTIFNNPTESIKKIGEWSYGKLIHFLEEAKGFAEESDENREGVISLLTLLHDRRYPVGGKKRSSVLALLQKTLYEILGETPENSKKYRLVKSGSLAPAYENGKILVVDAKGFPMEGLKGVTHFLVEAHRNGWTDFIVFDAMGQRFLGCGFGPHKKRISIDVFGSPGDYLGSGADNLEIRVHASGQDQLGQIMKGGKLVVYGDVGQTFLYGAKGGECFVLGNAAGRPLINAVGKPRVVINGTCLDYLAESFMAGNPLKGGGFAIVNGLRFEEGRIVEQQTPYPGGNLLSLASGGAIYVRDPHGRLDENQLNGGRYSKLSEEDWKLIIPYLKENERLFGIPVEALLNVDGVQKKPEEVYVKVEPVRQVVLSE